ncbi:CCA tRNA nucleotidyltransferase, partial [Candidatus Latescibacterota bacterium]
MKNLVPSSQLKKSAFNIVRTLRDAGFKAFIVGGAPRDMAMGLEPADYDISTDATPDDVAGLFDRTYPVGKKFGVSIVMYGEDSFEVSQFRTEGDYIDGRRPSRVAPADVTEDVKRRDFTMNAILYDPDRDELIDLVSGLEDIEAGIVKAIGDPQKRFAEDHLRMLRAVRFSARFHFRIESVTYEAIKRNARKIERISPERTGEELSKMFSGENPARALSLLDETGLLEAVLPEVHALKGVEQPEQFHPEGDVYEHTRLMLEMFDGGSPTLAFGILL